MPDIMVHERSGFDHKVVFSVEVSQVGTVTHHTVTVTKDHYEKLTENKISQEELVRRSFEFLLGRESNESIMRDFDLTIIPNYFPDYEEVIRENL